MLLNRTLFVLFGRDTRPAQWLNLLVAVLWLIVLPMHRYGVISFNLTEHIIDTNKALLSVNFAIVFFCWLGFITKSDMHQVFKTFSLVLGALSQAILAAGYVVAYPPLDIMLIVCTLLSVWFMSAVLYIVKCEGVNGCTARKR